MDHKILLSFLCIFSLGELIIANEIVLQNGYNGYEGCTDTYFRSEGDGVDMNFNYIHINYHSDTHLMTANCDGCVCTYTRAAYIFNLSSISVSSDNINKVTFSSYFLGGFQDNGEKTHLYRMIKEWKPDEATWVHAKKGEMWNPGADTLEQGGAFTEEDAAETGYAQPNEWEEYDITEILKYFLDHPDENYGFIIISDEDYNNVQRLYRSSDFTDTISQRPKLTIEYGTAVTYFPQTGLKDKINLTITNSSVRFSLSFNNSIVTISNAKGRKIVSFRENHRNSYEIPLSMLSNGVHLLNIKYNYRSDTIKFIVVK